MTLGKSPNSFQSVHLSEKMGPKVPTQSVAPSFIKFLLSLYLKAGTVLGAADIEWRTRGTKSLPHGALDQCSEDSM